MRYVDIPTGTVAMDTPSRIVLPFHHDEPVSWSEERVFTPDSPDWETRLSRWAFLHGYMPEPGDIATRASELRRSPPRSRRTTAAG